MSQLGGHKRGKMRRLIFILFIALVFSTSTYATLTLGETNTSIPSFEVEFFEYYENLEIESVFISLVGSEETFDLQEPEISADGRVYTYTSAANLQDADYIFYLFAYDEYGNNASESATFTVNRKDMAIYLKSPKLGISNHTPFMVEIEAEYESIECRVGQWIPEIHSPLNDSEIWKTLYGMNSTSNSAPTKYWEYNVTEFKYGAGEYPYIFMCTFAFPDNYNSELHILGYDSNATTITVNPDPHIIIERFELEKEVSISTDDKSVCFYEDSDGGIFPNPLPDFNNLDSYTYQRNFSFDYSDDFPQKYKQYDYVVTCKNLAGFVTKTNFTGILDLNTSYLITRISPTTQYVRQTTFDFHIETNLKTSSCVYNDGVFTSTNSDLTTFKTSLTLDQGTHTIGVTCTSIDNVPQPTQDFTFIVDTIKPTTPVIDADESCSLSILSAKWESEDNGSGIDYYNYSIKKGNTIIYSKNKDDDWRTTSSESVERKNLDLKEGDDYTWTVFAVDKSGSISDTATKKVKATDPDSKSCDKDEPHVEVEITLQDPGVTLFKILCVDNGVGCADDFNYSFQKRKEKNRCTFNQTDGIFRSFTKREPIYFCYHVEDKNGNAEEGIERIDVDGAGTGDECTKDAECDSGYTCELGNCVEEGTDPTNLNCSNKIKDGDETDVDCGGFCDRCDAGKSCDVDFDCDSYFCNSNICTEPSCTDAIKNGDETDVDCGGDCEQCELEDKCESDSDCKDDLVCRGDSCDIPYGVDTDNDGLSDAWEYEHFGTRTDAEPDDDPDRDGANNLEEYAAGTDPNDPEDRPEKDSILPLILLILGILLIIGGIAYLIVKKDEVQMSMQSNEPIMLQNKIEHKQNPAMPPTEKETANKIVSKLYKKRESQKKKAGMKKLLSSFDEKPGKNQDIKPLEKTNFSEKQKELLDKKKKADIEKKEVVAKTKPKTKEVKREGYVDVLDLKKQQELKKKDTKKQVFQKLVGLSKNKTAGKVKTAKTTTEKPSAEQPGKLVKVSASSSSSKGSVKTKPKMSNKEIFEKLVAISNQPKTKVNSVMKGGDEVSTEKMLDIFAKVTDKKQINQDVFKVILSELLGKGKITKSTVNSILFKFKDDELLTEKEINSIMHDLKLL